MGDLKTFKSEGIILENMNIATDWNRALDFPEKHSVTITQFPEGAGNFTSDESYKNYREGNATACADLMIVTFDEESQPAVLLSKRSKDVCYGGKWWMYGGAVKAYRPLEDSLIRRVRNECGLDVNLDVLVGVYHTIAEDFIGDTIQPCYASRVSIEMIRENMNIDDAHSDVRLFTQEDLDGLPEDEKFWYPMRVAEKVIASFLQASY